MDKPVDCIHSLDALGFEKPLTTELVFYTMVLTMPRLPRSPASPAQAPGLYRRHFTRAQCALLDRFPEQRGTSEINLLRVLLSRTLAAGGGQDISASQLAALLSAAVLTTLHLSILVRLHSSAAGDLSDSFQQFLGVIEDVNRLEGVK